MSDNNYKQDFIRFMVKSGVLLFGDFTTKSGRKTPYFVNTGNYKTGGQITKLGEYYAACIIENMNKGHIDKDLRLLFGPAYKGIPLAVSTAIALTKQNISVNYCFNRKESKDHGERGNLVGYTPEDGDRVLIVEDVLTAGTALRECLPQIMAVANVHVEGLIISVDRMEKGLKDKTASGELRDEFGLATYPIVTIREVLDTLYDKPVDGVIYIDADIRNRMLEYFSQYCVL